MPPEVEITLNACPACDNDELVRDDEQGHWTCAHCLSVTTDEGARALAGVPEGGPTGPMDLWR